MIMIGFLEMFNRSCPAFSSDLTDLLRTGQSEFRKHNFYLATSFVSATFPALFPAASSGIFDAIAAD